MATQCVSERNVLNDRNIGHCSTLVLNFFGLEVEMLRAASAPERDPTQTSMHCVVMSGETTRIGLHTVDDWCIFTIDQPSTIDRGTATGASDGNIGNYRLEPHRRATRRTQRPPPPRVALTGSSSLHVQHKVSRCANFLCRTDWRLFIPSVIHAGTSISIAWLPNRISKKLKIKKYKWN